MANPYRSGGGTRVESGEPVTARPKGRIFGKMPHPGDTNPNVPGGGGPAGPPGSGSNRPPADTWGNRPTIDPDGAEPAKRKAADRGRGRG